MQQTHDWVPAPEAWKKFIQAHPELGYREGMWPFHNFLRFHRAQLQAADAIRKARKRFWIANVTRFVETAFACATGQAELANVSGASSSTRPAS